MWYRIDIIDYGIIIYCVYIEKAYWIEPFTDLQLANRSNEYIFIWKNARVYWLKKKTFEKSYSRLFMNST